MLVRALPYSPARLLSRITVVAYLVLRPDCRSEIKRNARTVLRRDKKWFWVAHAWRLGANLALMARADQRSGQAIVDTAVVYGDNITCRCLEQELHMTMVSFHFGAWEYLPRVFAKLGYRVALTTGNQPDNLVQTQVARLRHLPNVEVTRGPKEAFAAVARPGISGFVLDNTSRGSQSWVDVDGLGFRMPTFPFEIAARRDEMVLPALARIERGRMRIDVGRPGDRNSVARFLLDNVRAWPEEWVFWGKSGAVR